MFTRLGILLISAMSILGLIACAKIDEPGVIRVWCHQGQEQENLAMRAMAKAFNEAHAAKGIRVRIEFFPDYQYTERISIAAAARDLPDVFDLDGPTVAQFVDAGLLAPLDPYFTEEERNDFLDTIIDQGTIHNTLYALGAFDSAMVLYYDKARLTEAGVAPPAEGTAWTWEEFMEACRTLKAAGMDPVSLHMDITADEWYTYAFSPLLWSAGGALMNPAEERVMGVLNDATNVRVLTAWQQLFEEGLAARAPINPDPFGAGETVMDWNGHWMARAHLEAKGDNLGVMPLPRTGPEPVAACGSWCWAISAHTPHSDLAIKWLKWVTDPKTGVEPIVRAGGAVPARLSAFEYFPQYEEDPWRLFKVQLRDHGRPRPKTPFYPNLTQHVAAALRDIAYGADVETRLTRAAEAVQRIVDRRQGAGT